MSGGKTYRHPGQVAPPPSIRCDVEFTSGRDTIRAWHYLPRVDSLRGRHGSPIVVMAHGLSMTRDGGLAPYAEAFSRAGCHVLVFDYRGFGDSGGEPRELVSVRRQLKDYESAIDFARRLEDVDPGRVALWGTSYSGGHVIEIASRDARIAAVISQVPNLDSLATLRFLLRRTPVCRLLWLASAIVRDALRGLLRRKPLYVRSIAPSGDRAAYVSERGWSDVQQIKGPNFRNRFAPRDFLRFPPYRPIRRVRHVRCRMFLVAAEQDDLTPSKPAFDAARIAGPRAEVLGYPVGHFGVYVEPVISDVLPRQVAFLTRELAPA